MSKKIKKVVLAYSEVVCFSADIGQEEELSGLDEKAKRSGASKLYIEDLREEFARDFVFPMLRGNAVYEGTYLLGTSIARPLIAKTQIAIAEKEGADAVCHGATGKGNDQVRFELTYYALKPDITVIAPWREWTMQSRSDLIDYAEANGIPITATREKPYSTDRNLFHISFEGGVLEDTWAAPPADMYLMTLPLEKASNTPEEIDIGYEAGDPVSVGGERLSPAQLLIRLNAIGKSHGIGRVDLVENRFVGMKSRGVYETPGGTILHTAHRALESLTVDREVLHLRDSLIPKFAELIYNGFWYAPERQWLSRALDDAQKTVTGTVRLKLYKGNVQVLGRKSPYSLFHQGFATFEADTVYRQADAEGFIRLQSLRLRIAKLLEKKGA